MLIDNYDYLDFLINKENEELELLIHGYFLRLDEIARFQKNELEAKKRLLEKGLIESYSGNNFSNLLKRKTKFKS